MGVARTKCGLSRQQLVEQEAEVNHLHVWRFPCPTDASARYPVAFDDPKDFSAGKVYDVYLTHAQPE
jgi:hypothetical protein